MWYLDFRSTRGQKVNPALAREVPLVVGMAQSVHLGLIGFVSLCYVSLCYAMLIDAWELR